MNLGKVSNKGVELLVGVTPVRTSNFAWDISVNYTRNRSKVESLPEELGGEITLYSFSATQTTSMVATVGDPIGEYKVTVPKKTPDGRIIVDDTKGKPIAADNLAVVGNMNYDYMMGITNNFSFKSWSLGFNIDIRQGGLMYSRTKEITSFTGNSAQTLYNDRRPFIVPNSVNEITNDDGSVSYVENTTPVTKYNTWEYFQDGTDQLAAYNLIPKSYVKLRSVNISYQLPQKWLNNSQSNQ